MSDKLRNTLCNEDNKSDSGVVELRNCAAFDVYFTAQRAKA